MKFITTVYVGTIHTDTRQNENYTVHLLRGHPVQRVLRTSHSDSHVVLAWTGPAVPTVVSGPSYYFLSNYPIEISLV